MKLEADGLSFAQARDLHGRLYEMGVRFGFKCSYCGWPLQCYRKYEDRDGYRHAPGNPSICVRAEDPGD